MFNPKPCALHMTTAPRNGPDCGCDVLCCAGRRDALTLPRIQLTNEAPTQCRATTGAALTCPTAKWLLSPLLLVCRLRGLEGLRVLGVLLPVCGSPPAASVASDATPERVTTRCKQQAGNTTLRILTHAASITVLRWCQVVLGSQPPHGPDLSHATKALRSSQAMLTRRCK